MAWLTGWTYRRVVRVRNPENVAMTNSQHELLLNAANFDFSNANANGDDLRFTTGNGATNIPYYIRSWDATLGVASVVVKIPSRAAVVDTTILMYYGNDSAAAVSSYDDTFAKLSVDADTLALWHFDEGEGTSLTDETDSYALALSGSPSWKGSDEGRFGDNNVFFASGDSLVFNGLDQCATIDTLLDVFPAQGTLMFWMLTPDVIATMANTRLFVKINDETPGANELFDVYVNDELKLVVRAINNGASTSLVSATTLHTARYHVAFTWGPAGWRLYLDSDRDAYDPTQSVVCGDGTARDAIVAAYNYGGTVQCYAPVTLDELCILSRQANYDEIRRHYWRMKHTPGQLGQFSRLTRSTNNPIIAPTLESEGDACYEPSIDYRDGLWRLWYSGGDGPAAGDGAVHYATSADGETSWTKNGVVVGAGEGGEESTAYRSHVFVDDDGTYYCYYSSPGMGGDLKFATSADGETWSYGGMALESACQEWIDSENGGIANTFVFNDGGVYYLLFEAYCASLPRWRIGLATASAPGGPWTPYASNPLTTLMVESDAMYGGPWCAKLNGQYVLWYHAFPATSGGATPTLGYYAVSADLHTWQQPIDRLMLDMDEYDILAGQDQVADLDLHHDAASTRVYYDIDDNVGTYEAALCLAEYSGPLRDFAALPTVEAELTSERSAGRGCGNMLPTLLFPRGGFRISSVSPATLAQGATEQDVVITGAGFAAGCAADFGAGITVNSTTRTSAASLTANITVAAGASVATRDVTVTNLDARATIRSAAFSVARNEYYLSDSFVRANSNTIGAADCYLGGSPATWEEQRGGWEIIANALVNHTPSDESAENVCVVDSGVADCVVHARVYIGASAVSVGLALRQTTIDHGWELNLQIPNVWILIENNNGSRDGKAQAAPTVNKEQWYDILVTLQGNTITATLDGGNSISYSSATFNNTATKHGAYSWNNAPDSKIDQFYVKELLA